MKLEIVKKKTAFYFITSGAIFLVLCLVSYFYFNNQSSDSQKIAELQSETERIKGEITTSEQDMEKVKKYQESFRTMPNKQKTFGNIPSDEIKSSFNKIINKYAAKNQEIKILDQEQVKEDAIPVKAITVSKNEIEISFDAYSDVIAAQVLDEFIDSLNGYLTIKSFEIVKGENYSDEDLIAISGGKAKPTIVVKSKAVLYTLNPSKPAEAAAPQQTNP